MVEPADAKELIEAAIERAEDERDTAQATERATERRFRDRVSLMVGVLAVSLAVIHMAAASAARESLLKGIEASDTFNYMQAKIIREAVYKTAAGSPALSEISRTNWTKETVRLRAADAAGHGIDQLRVAGERLREEGTRAARDGEGYETGETALQVGIVLLSIALIAGSRKIVLGALLLALVGIGAAIATACGLAIV